MRFKKVAKAIGALLGGVTGLGVAEFTRMFNVELDPGIAGLIAAVLASLGAYLAPKNEEPVMPVEADELFVDREEESYGRHSI